MYGAIAWCKWESEDADFFERASYLYTHFFMKKEKKKKKAQQKVNSARKEYSNVIKAQWKPLTVN